MERALWKVGWGVGPHSRLRRGALDAVGFSALFVGQLQPKTKVQGYFRHASPSPLAPVSPLLSLDMDFREAAPLPASYFFSPNPYSRRPGSRVFLDDV
jgi:hypothetical protein